MSSVLLEIRNNVACITLNRPEKFNCFNREMALSLQKTLKECDADKNIKTIYITGKGKAFCAGQDLGELVGENPPGFEVILEEHYNPIVTIIRTIGKPVVCAVNGIAAGAGVNIALCCDIVVAAQSATFIQAFSKIGLIPDSGGTFILPTVNWLSKASALMLLGEKLSATDAERVGMLYKIFPDESFAEESMKIAVILSQMPAKGLAYTKQALNASPGNSLQQQLQLENKLQNEAAHTHDFEEGLKAFLEKRQPNFKSE